MSEQTSDRKRILSPRTRAIGNALRIEKIGACGQHYSMSRRQQHLAAANAGRRGSSTEASGFLPADYQNKARPEISRPETKSDPIEVSRSFDI
jgi:hypothetical protein